MSYLMDRITEDAGELPNREFKLLIVMAKHAKNNPPEYGMGHELLADYLYPRTPFEMSRRSIARESRN